MIVKIKDGKITCLKIGDSTPERGEICVPEDWGSQKIVSTFVENEEVFGDSFSCYTIDDSDPDSPFRLREI